MNAENMFSGHLLHTHAQCVPLHLPARYRRHSNKAMSNAATCFQNWHNKVISQ